MDDHAPESEQPIQLRQDPDAWTAGFRSGVAGDPAPCPYPPETVQAWSWQAGRIEGLAQPPGTTPPEARPESP